MHLLVGLAIHILPFVGAEAAHHKADGDQVELFAESPCATWSIAIKGSKWVGEGGL